MLDRGVAWEGGVAGVEACLWGVFSSGRVGTVVADGSRTPHRDFWVLGFVRR